MQALQTMFDFFRGVATPSAPRPDVRLEPAATPTAPRFAEPRVSESHTGLSKPAVPITQLERDLSLLLGSAVLISITDNTRTMVSAKHRAGVSHVRLHRMFTTADATTLQSIARFLTRRDRRAISALRQYVAEHQGDVRRRSSRRLLLSAIGEHHDLSAIFDELNALYFGGGVQARIGWGRMGRSPRARSGRKARRRSIKLGSYLSTGALIRVHPVLDAGWVPRMFVEYIVYHEMLHHVVDMPVRDGRRCMHGAEFKARERQYARYDAAIAWEREHLDRLLSS